MTIVVFESRSQLGRSTLIYYSPAIALLLIIFYFLTHTVEVKKERIELKNIFGLKINTLDLRTKFTRKVRQRSASTQGEVLWTMLSKKYQTITEITFKSEVKRKAFRLNGHIFSQSGLHKFLKLTKK